MSERANDIVETREKLESEKSWDSSYGDTGAREARH